MAILRNLPRTCAGLQIVPESPAVFAEVSLILSEVSAILTNALPILAEVPPVFPYVSFPCVSVLCECGLLKSRQYERQTAEHHPVLSLHSFLLVEWVGSTSQA
jgi:hypothetical protein